MIYYTVSVIDKISNLEVCIGSMLSKGEAYSIKNYLDRFNACNVIIKKEFFIWRKCK